MDALAVVAKASDAASMFWQSLDEGERRLLLYLGGYLLLSALFGLQRRSREQLKAELREELHGARSS